MATERVKTYCRNCGGIKNHFVCHEQDDKSAPIQTGDAEPLPRKKYQMVECAGCEIVSFRELLPDGDSMVENLYPPRMIRAAQNYDTPASRVPPEIAAIYKATMSAFNSGADNSSSFILCAGGIRCMLELICADLGIGGLNLEEKIKGLDKERYLTPAHTAHLQNARFLGNDALHEGRVPSQSELGELLDIFEDTINDLYIRPELFEKNALETATITAIRDDGIEVRVGKSTPSFIPRSEVGIEPGDNIANVVQVRQQVSVKVMSDRDEPLLLSKKEADVIIVREAEERRIEEETRKARWEALKQIRQYDLLEGIVTQARPNGIVVNVTKGDTVIEGWVPSEELDTPRNQTLYQAFRNGRRINVLVLNVVPENEELILSKKAGDWENAYRNAEESFSRRTILQGRVTRVAPDGKRLFIGIGCLGIVHESQVGQLGEGEQVNLNEWVNQTIPVRVTIQPDRFRKAPLQMSHRAALKRKEALAALQVGQQFIGKVTGVYSWGALVSVSGVDGVLQKVDMASQRLTKDDEIQLEIIQLNPHKGQLGLKIVSTVATDTGTGEDMDIEEDMDTEGDVYSGDEGMGTETSGNSQENEDADSVEEDSNPNVQEHMHIEDEGTNGQAGE